MAAWGASCGHLIDILEGVTTLPDCIESVDRRTLASRAISIGIGGGNVLERGATLVQQLRSCLAIAATGEPLYLVERADMFGCAEILRWFRDLQCRI